MKTLVFPKVNPETEISSSTFDTWYKGLIIVYKENKSIGYISFDEIDQTWTFCTSANRDSNLCAGDSLDELANKLNNQHKMTLDYKVIIFE